jgi:hypothetical protein
MEAFCQKGAAVRLSRRAQWFGEALTSGEVERGEKWKTVKCEVVTGK